MTICKDCVKNTFSAAKNRETPCQNCGTGRSSVAGSIVCSSCGAGQKINTVDSTCFDCLAGFFTASANLKECAPCKLGRYQSDTGQALCLPCSPGEFQKNSGATKCELCAESTFFGGKARNRTCVHCPTGWSSAEGSTKCQACGAGTYGDGCKSCPEGYARHGTDHDATQCRLCKLGETTTSIASASCERWYVIFVHIFIFFFLIYHVSF